MLSRRWVALVLPFGACFYDWDDAPVLGSGGSSTQSSVAQSGGQPPGMSSVGATSTGGVAGSGGCLLCQQIVQQCVNGRCPEPVAEQVCSGTAENALEALVDCVCPVCQSSCSNTCSTIGTDDPGCTDCLINQANANCGPELNGCLQN